MSKWVNKFRTKVRKLIPTSKRRIVEETYDFKEDLGVGIYSVVKKAVHKRTGEVVAIKIYDKTQMPTLDKGCLNTEADILKSLMHPNVISIKQSYDTPKRLYIVMEFMGGGELLDYIRKRKVFPEREASSIFKQIVSALAYLHSIGIVHRDIKPDNLLLASEGEDPVVKIADFGFAKRIGDGVLHTPCGSPVYTAPEIVREEPYNKSVDMWSAGVLLYILLCGFPPFYHRDPSKLFEEIEKGVFDFPDPQWSNISPSAKELVSLLLKLESSERLTAQQSLDHSWLSNPPSENSLPSSVRLKSLNTKDFKEVVGNCESTGEQFHSCEAVDSPVWKRRAEVMPKGKEPCCTDTCETHSSNNNSNSCCGGGGTSVEEGGTPSSYSFEVRLDELSVKSDSSNEEFTLGEN